MLLLTVARYWPSISPTKTPDPLLRLLRSRPLIAFRFGSVGAVGSNPHGDPAPKPFGCTTGVRWVEGLGMVHLRNLDLPLGAMAVATRLFRFRATSSQDRMMSDGVAQAMVTSGRFLKGNDCGRLMQSIQKLSLPSTWLRTPMVNRMMIL